MYQNYKINRLNRIIFVVAILILLGGGVFLAFNFLAPASEPVSAASVTSSTTSAVIDDSTYQGQCYLNYNWGSASIPTPTITATGETSSLSPVGTLSWVAFSISPLTGYSWSNSVTSFTVTYASGTSETSMAEALSTAQTNLSSSTTTVNATRSGNTFTFETSLTKSLYADNFFTGISTPYAVIAATITIPSDAYTANSYVLTFVYNGGQGSIATKNVVYDSAIGTLPTANRDNYIFQGWYIGSTQLTETKTWTYTSNQTAVARWEFDGYTLTPSIDGGVGGSIIGADAGEYPKNSSVTVTASADIGYIFDHWVLNGTSTTANPLTFTITQDSTLVAYFREVPSIIPTFSGATTTPTYNITKDGENYYLTVYPLDSDSATEYVYSVTIGSREYILSYYRAYIYDTGGANEIIYYVKDDSNIFNMKFEHLFATTRVTINLTTNRPTYQNPPLGGASISGVAAQATTGGEARITGVDLTETESTVHLSAISYTGYRFTGWTASDGTDLSAYSSSADIPLSLIEGKVITANFASTVSNDINSDTDNTGDIYL